MPFAVAIGVQRYPRLARVRRSETAFCSTKMKQLQTGEAIPDAALVLHTAQNVPLSPPAVGVDYRWSTRGKLARWNPLVVRAAL
jgi:hypothetical protein